MQEVIDALAKNQNQTIFLFGGGAKEIQLLNQLQNKHVNVIVLAGKLKFKQELEVISNLDVMLSMDSGNAHIAAMLGVKVITLWAQHILLPDLNLSINRMIFVLLRTEKNFLCCPLLFMEIKKWQVTKMQCEQFRWKKWLQQSNSS